MGNRDTILDITPTKREGLTRPAARHRHQAHQKAIPLCRQRVDRPNPQRVDQQLQAHSLDHDRPPDKWTAAAPCRGLGKKSDRISADLGRARAPRRLGEDAGQDAHSLDQGGRADFRPFELVLPFHQVLDVDDCDRAGAEARSDVLAIDERIALPGLGGKAAASERRPNVIDKVGQCQSLSRWLCRHPWVRREAADVAPLKAAICTAFASLPTNEARNAAVP